MNSVKSPEPRHHYSSWEMASWHYHPDTSFVGAFINEMCEVDPLEAVDSLSLYNHYLVWGKPIGARFLTRQAFGRCLTALGFHRRKSSGTTRWYGLKITGRKDPT